MEPQWGGEKSLKAAEKDHTLTDRVCAFKTSWAECRDQKRCRHRANGGDFSLDIHSYRTILFTGLEMADKIPDYAFNPLRRCLDSVFITNRLLHLSVNGLQIILNRPQMVQRLI